MNPARTHTSEILDRFFNTEESPLLYEQTLRKMIISARIDNAIKLKGWSKKQFALSLNRTPSEISKWLSGTHNFTIDTLTEIEHSLEVNLLNAKLEDENKFCNPIQAILVPH